jgi:hypothetical protein
LSKKKELGDPEKIVKVEIMFVVVVKCTFHIRHFIPILKLNIKVNNHKVPKKVVKTIKEEGQNWMKIFQRFI